MNDHVWPGRSKPEHVESYFIRANDPEGPTAIWLKATILARPGHEPTSSLWCVVFDGDKRWGGRTTDIAQQAVDGHCFRQAGCTLLIDGQSGQASGQLSNEAGTCRWELSWSAVEGALGRPMSLFPFDWMLGGGFPKSKLVTPAPLVRVQGVFYWNEVAYKVDQWLGMQGHNWGVEHSPEYVWGQAWFGEREPDCIVEGFTGRTRIGGVLTPRLSNLVVRTTSHEYRFDRFWRIRSQRGVMGSMGAWHLEMSSKEAVAKLWMAAPPVRSVCLGYENPNGELSYCYNSKTARAHLWLQAKDGTTLARRSHCAALEFLSSSRDERYGAVI